MFQSRSLAYRNVPEQISSIQEVSEEIFSTQEVLERGSVLQVVREESFLPTGSYRRFVSTKQEVTGESSPPNRKLQESHLYQTRSYRRVISTKQEVTEESSVPVKEAMRDLGQEVNIDTNIILLVHPPGFLHRPVVQEVDGE